jgi:serine/threonine protein phosphatase 1
MVTLPKARVPEGLRLYAIGDVHGRADLLAEMHIRIARDLVQRPVADWRVIHLGDYIDRGPDSARVLKLLVDYKRGGHADFLIGNHDAFLRDFLDDPESADLDLWIINSGGEALRSFGVDPMLATLSADADVFQKLCEALTAAVPKEVREFIDDLTHMVRYGDYLFVHAGLRPGVPLAEQTEHDLVWIREPFLSSQEDFGAVVVHGHSPAAEVAVRPNRIGIDTGAVFTGRLTCLVLEGTERHLLGREGLETLPAASFWDEAVH